MTCSSDSRLASQERPQRRNSFTALSGEQQKSMQRQLGIEEYVQSDKRVFARLLKLGLASSISQGKTIKLGGNEEWPRIIPILCTCFSREELVELLGEQMASQFLKMYRTETLQNLYLEPELQKVLHTFNEANIPFLLLKGAALAHTVYTRPDLRTYHDIDALIHPRDLARAHDLLVEMGYIPYEEFRADTLDKNRTGYHYILRHSNTWLEVLIELHTAPHAGEIATAFDVDSMWANAHTITVLGESTLTLNPIDHLLYLCWHYRFHGFARLLWLYDLVVMLRAIDSELHWEALVQEARRQHLATTLYYCLSWCRSLFAVAIPDDVFASLRPPWACRLIVERFTLTDPARALVSSDWQPRRIIAHRAMVDSIAALLQVGISAFFPSRVILGKRYMQHSRLPLQLSLLFYFVHPWITLVKGCCYLLLRKDKSK